MPLPFVFMLCLLGLLAGCAMPPALQAGARIPVSGDAVKLLPLEELLAQAGNGVSVGDAADDGRATDLAERAKRLRARATGAR